MERFGLLFREAWSRSGQSVGSVEVDLERFGWFWLHFREAWSRSGQNVGSVEIDLERFGWF